MCKNNHRSPIPGAPTETAKREGNSEEFKLSYTLIRSFRRKKTLAIQVGTDGTVVIRVPFRTSQAEIDRFLREKQQWLLKTISRRRQQNHERQARAFIPGERFDYLGESYRLALCGDDVPGAALVFTGREFLLKESALGGGRILFCLWYQKQARTHLQERVRHFGGILGLAPADVNINKSSSNWGSCSSDGRLRFAWRLIMAPPEIIDYVVVHELCHMIIRNHSRDYWRLVKRILPGCHEQKIWLRDHGHLLTL